MLILNNHTPINKKTNEQMLKTFIDVLQGDEIFHFWEMNLTEN